MFLNPRSFPREQVIQRHVLEGVQGVSDLDMTAQTTGKIQLQIFDRSGGLSNNVRFNLYTDLAPHVAAELVARAKRDATAQSGYPAANNYAQPYVPAPHVPQAYPQTQALVGMPLHLQPAATALAITPDLSSLVSQFDNSTLQQLLASLQGSQPNMSIQAAAPPVTAETAPAPAYLQSTQPAGPNPPIDINALLGNLRNAANGAASSVSYGSVAYAAPGTTALSQTAPTANQPLQPPAGLDPSVQSIMAQLAQYGRQ